ncbi:DedA family protein [Schumannella sp. 10F1B-5-1]|uniref:DedA family protein n=1 Tax=Schumannella sp. 10F1B-5-1 TaxID=2590780 RepID=UPI001130E784|nr:DedA family protein [Schumannella sp. 10F1B-5-1]TPW73536.1 DedA family protein [Schumannella sp. 10F1B-5-1]
MSAAVLTTLPVLPSPADLPRAGVPSTSNADADPADLDGLVGVAARVIDALGEAGVGLLTLVETVFPPIPSEVILPLAGFLASLGAMNLALVLIAATAGSYLGALVLYALGARLGLDRAIGLLARLPLVDREDFEKSSDWFRRHGGRSVLFGRLIPGVRSLVSIPAGAQRMPLWRFSLFTIVGSAVWNSLLVGLGAALGSQYELIDEWSGVLDWVVIAAVVGGVAWLVVRRIRRSRAARRHVDARDAQDPA